MRSFVTFIVLFSAFQTFAQEKSIYGKITDEKENPLAYAELLLRSLPDSSFYKGEVSREDGSFEFSYVKEGTYYLEIRSLGFTTQFIHEIIISKESSSINSGTIILTEASSELTTVSVIAEKPFIEKHPDKTVVNIESSIIQTGSTLLEVLEKLPGIQVDQNGNIRVNGKQGTVIMLDGKPTALSGQDLANLLRGMPSDNVVKIEIITNPSAKYEAAGNAGIINIITKKNQKFGYSGSFTLGYGQGKYGKYNTSFNLNYRKSKFNFFSYYSYSNRNGFVNLILNRKFYDNGVAEETFETDNYIKINFITHLPKIGVDYDLTEKTRISVIGTGVLPVFTDNTSTHTAILDQFMNQTGKYSFSNQANSNFYNYDINLQLRHKLDSTGQELIVNLDYGSYKSKATQLFNTTFYDYINSGYISRDLTGIQMGNLSLASLKADYSKPLKNDLLFETGWKSSMVGSDRNMQFYTIENSLQQFDRARSSHFLYSEIIHALYINFSKKLSKFSLQGGLRMENTIAKGTQELTGESF